MIERGPAADRASGADSTPPLGPTEERVEAADGERPHDRAAEAAAAAETSIASVMNVISR